ncbi:apyrase-like isoform X2 [Epargyreus clarus]
MCASNNSSCLGGFARLYYEIQELLREKPCALLLNAGDTFQGSFWYTLLKWNVTQEFINMLPNDAHAIGNHEFDDGIAGIVPYLAALRAPVLAANIDTTNEPSLNGLYKSHVIITRNGRQIGIIGLITPETKISSKSQGVIFLDPIQVVYKEAQMLTDKHVDIIIVLSHCGLEVDKEIAKTAGKNIDVIVGGHSHSLLWNGESPSNEEISGPYPVLVETESTDHKVLIVTASAFTKYLGNLTVYFDKNGELQSYEGSPVFLNRSIPEDPGILKLMQPYKDKLRVIVEEVVGTAADSLVAKPCGSSECAIGDIIADAFLNATKSLNVSNLHHVAFLARNMIRGSIAKGDITRGVLINALPFTNTVTTFTLRGKYLLEVFKRCMKNYWVAKPFDGPWMPQVAGIKLTINVTDINDVNVDILIKEDEFRPLEMEEEYQITTVDFLLHGGNGFYMLKEYARNMRQIGKDIDVVEPYLRSLSPISATLDNRLTIIN